MKRIGKLVTPSSVYLLINIAVSGVGFIRSFAFMKALDINVLGVISLVQTGILFLGLLQFGLINGGYRIFALDNSDFQKRINNLIFSYFAVISLLLFGVLGIIFIFGYQLVLSNGLLFVALFCGILSLIMNWLTNTLIGLRLIRDINWINAIAGGVSLLTLPLIFIYGLTGAVISLMAQPLLFVVITLWRRKELRPSAWNFDLSLIRYVLSFGFIPFLAGIFGMINMQIERWSIADILGTEALGQFYLVFLYSTLFVLIPSSLLNIFFPRAIFAYENFQMNEFKRIIKQYSMLLLSYLVLVFVFTILALQPVIDWILPEHSLNTQYVFIFLPGLLVLSLCDPISIIFNSAVRLKPFLYAGVGSVIMTILFVFYANKFECYNLTNVAILKTMINTSVCLYYFIYVVINRKSIFKR